MLEKNLPQYRTRCVTRVTIFQLYFLFVFDSNDIIITIF